MGVFLLDIYCLRVKNAFYSNLMLQGNVSIETQSTAEATVLRINGKFADMLLPFKQYDVPFRPSRFRCSRLNEKYFGTGIAEGIYPPDNGIYELRIGSVSEDRTHHLKRLEKDIGVVMKGVVGGLSNGRIALHKAGLMRKDCGPGNELSNNESNFPIKLMIVNTRTNEIMVEYTAVWE
jgi:hypothetical protein